MLNHESVDNYTKWNLDSEYEIISTHNLSGN